MCVFVWMGVGGLVGMCMVGVGMLVGVAVDVSEWMSLNLSMGVLLSVRVGVVGWMNSHRTLVAAGNSRSCFPFPLRRSYQRARGGVLRTSGRSGCSPRVYLHYEDALMNMHR